MTNKPIKVFYSELSDRFFATQHYRDRGDGNFEVTGAKYDVTDDIGRAVTQFDIEFTPIKGES